METQQKMSINVYTTIKAAGIRIEEEDKEDELWNISLVVDTIS